MLEMKNNSQINYYIFDTNRKESTTLEDECESLFYITRSIKKSNGARFSPGPSRACLICNERACQYIYNSAIEHCPITFDACAKQVPNTPLFACSVKRTYSANNSQSNPFVGRFVRSTSLLTPKSRPSFNG